MLLRSIIRGTVRFLPMAIPCTLTYPSRNNLPLISPDLPLGPRNLPLKTLRHRKSQIVSIPQFWFRFCPVCIAGSSAENPCAYRPMCRSCPHRRRRPPSSNWESSWFFLYNRLSGFRSCWAALHCWWIHGNRRQLVGFSSFPAPGPFPLSQGSVKFFAHQAGRNLVFNIDRMGKQFTSQSSLCIQRIIGENSMLPLLLFLRLLAPCSAIIFQIDILSDLDQLFVNFDIVFWFNSHCCCLHFWKFGKTEFQKRRTATTICEIQLLGVKENRNVQPEKLHVPVAIFFNKLRRYKYKVSIYLVKTYFWQSVGFYPADKKTLSAWKFFLPEEIPWDILLLFSRKISGFHPEG